MIERPFEAREVGENSMRRREVMVGMGVAVGLLAVLWGAHISDLGGASAVHEASEPTTHGASDFTALPTATAAALVAPLRGPAPVASSDATSPAPAPSPATPRPFEYEPPLERALELATDRAQLNARWSAEGRDSSWRAQTESRLRAIFTKRGLDARDVGEVDCRATICRFAVHTSSKTDPDVGNLIQAARAIDQQTWTMPEEHEVGYSVEVYFPKEGYRLSSGGGRIDEPMAVLEAPH
jgi:hypothetical protein